SLFVSQCFFAHHDLYSFPTRRSSDLETIEQALELAKAGNSSLTAQDLKQDKDALDTWFSSWLWPMSVFGGIMNPENEEYKYYYPDRKSTRLNSSHVKISYAVFCLKKK